MRNIQEYYHSIYRTSWDIAKRLIVLFNSDGERVKVKF